MKRTAPVAERLVEKERTDEEIVASLADPKYFIETFLWIVDKERNTVPFIFNAPQNRYYKARTHYDLILKARKEGFSTEIAALWFHACLFEQNTHAVILSHEKQATVRLLDRVRHFIKTMGGTSDGQEFRIEVVLDTETDMELSFPETNSRYWIGTAGSRAFGRGDDITHLHFSEVAHYTNQQMVTGVLEACVPNAWRVMESTANGVGELLYRLWKEAEDPASGSAWTGHFFAWFEDPTNSLPLPQGVPVNFTKEERRMQRAHKLTPEQVYWYRKKRSTLADKALMPQEYPSTAREAFVTSGRHCFNMERLAEIRLSVEKDTKELGDIRDDGADLKFAPSPEGPLTVWKRPARNRSYFISADVAKGVLGGNFSVADVWDRHSGEQVAQLRGRWHPTMYGDLLVDLGRFYNNAAVLPENNSLGLTTIAAMIAKKYPHIVRVKEVLKDKKGAAGEEFGFPTTDTRNYDGPRSLAIEALRNAVDDGTHVIHSVLTIGECETFIQNPDNGRWEAQEGCQDDCVLSGAIGVFALKFLKLDETYGEHSVHKMGNSKVLIQSITGRQKQVGGGYRRRTGQ
jgi:hypothetical protein